MRIDVYDELNDGSLRLAMRDTTPEAIMGDDHEGLAQVIADLKRKGRASYGGGAAPFFMLFVSLPNHGR